MNKRLIDGDKLLEWTRKHIEGKAKLIMSLTGSQRTYVEGVRDAFITVEDKLESLQPTPSDQGEAARLRESLDKIKNYATLTNPYHVYFYEMADEALSSPTAEPAVHPNIEAIVDRCSDLNHYDTEEHNSPECVNELSIEDQAEVEEWVSDMLRNCARMAIDMYLDEQGIIPGITDGGDNNA